MGRDKRNKGDSSRVAGGFCAMPWDVLDSAAYQALSHPARSLLMELARQYVRDNNGRLLASQAYLAKRGWKSSDTITRAKRELIDAGFIYETVKGHRPNKASWYAITWYTLDRLPGYDMGAVEGFQHGAYRKTQALHRLTV
ncbi:helix-turn-helix domain-containing protein [Ottowia pentelensis]|uniref:Helix-turn-helix domain-containing protein n=1 Tax=Ottowia pentelensis TaxID=511108 RepID=A0ABV6PTT1_9BURK